MWRDYPLFGGFKCIIKMGMRGCPFLGGLVTIPSQTDDLFHLQVPNPLNSVYISDLDQRPGDPLYQVSYKKEPNVIMHNLFEC